MHLTSCWLGKNGDDWVICYQASPDLFTKRVKGQSEEKETEQINVRPLAVSAQNWHMIAFVTFYRLKLVKRPAQIQDMKK